MKRGLYYSSIICLAIASWLVLSGILALLFNGTNSFSYHFGSWCGTPYTLLLAIGLALLFRNVIYRTIFQRAKKHKPIITTIVIILAVIWGSVSIGAKSVSNKTTDTEFNKQRIQEEYIRMCSEVNKQVPLRVDRITSIKSIVFFDWTLTTYYSIDLNKDDFTEQELKELLALIKENIKKQIPSMIANGDYPFSQSQVYRYLKGTGLMLRYVYHDINDKQMGAFQFDYTDFIPTE